MPESYTEAGDVLSVGDELVRHAVRNVAHYRNRYTTAVSALSELAVLEKASVLGDERSFIADGHRDEELKYLATSGTTGTPLRRYYRRTEGVRAALPLWKARRWYGVDSTRMPSARFFSDEHGRGRVQFEGGILSLSVRDLSEASFREYHDALHRSRPVWFQVVPSVAGIFSRWLCTKGLTGPDSLRLIELNSEPTLPHDRLDIEAAFPGARLADHYGSKETWCIAYECPRGHRHIMSENVDVEVLAGDRPARHGMGTLVVTARSFRAMPLLRYNIGDRASLQEESCSCGRTGSVLKQIEGRIAEYAIGDRGEPVYQTYFDIGVRQAIRNWPRSISRYQFRQKGSTLTAVVEPGPAWREPVTDMLIEYLRPVFPDSEIEVSIGQVEPAIGRKFRSIVSDRTDGAAGRTGEPALVRTGGCGE